MIGLDQWIEAGRWWFLRSRMELFAVSNQNQRIPRAAYLNLIKASWILVDIIAMHPQVPCITTSTDAEVRLLSADIRNEFARLSSLTSVVPSLDVLDTEEIRIWEMAKQESFLRTYKDFQDLSWTADGNELVMFRKYAICYLQSRTNPVPCIVLFLVHKAAKDAHILAQSQEGLVIMDINFHTCVAASDDRVRVHVNEQDLVFADSEDPAFLRCLVQATNFYFFDRENDRCRLGDFQAYCLLFAVKCRRRDVVLRIFQRPLYRDLMPPAQETTEALSVASHCASLSLKNNFREESRMVASDKPNPSESRLSALVYCIDISKSLLHEKDESIFLWAVRCDHRSVVRLLINDQVKVENTLEKMLALILADTHRHREVICHLVQHALGVGEEGDKYDEKSYQALHRVITEGQEKLLELLQNHRGNAHGQFKAAAWSHLRAMKLQLDNFARTFGESCQTVALNRLKTEINSGSNCF